METCREVRLTRVAGESLGTRPPSCEIDETGAFPEDLADDLAGQEAVEEAASTGGP